MSRGMVWTRRLEAQEGRLATAFEGWPVRAWVRYTPAMKGSSSVSTRFEPRRAHRFPTAFTVSFFNQGYVGQGTVTDLSLTGCGVVGNQVVRCGETLCFHATGPGEAPLLAGSCVIVRWVLGQEFGAEIVRAQPKVQRRLRDWVKLMAMKR